MSRSVQQFLGDGDGPATEGAKPETRGPLLIMARSVTSNWRVSREGELVVITIGNLSPIRIPWSQAVPFGHAIMAKAVEAKVQGGGMGKRIATK